jgi:acetyl esterase/lipase
MALSYDPQVAAAMAPQIALSAGVTPPPAGDWQTRRANAALTMPGRFAKLPDSDRVVSRDFALTRDDGAELLLRWYEPPGRIGPGAALYVHGGGMIMGSVELYDRAIASYAGGSGVPMLAVDYRVAPEHPHPVPVEDSYAGLVWLAEHAAELGADPARIGIMGDSAGGGLAAAVTRLAHQRGGPALTRQILIYPMLDDRTTLPDPELAGLATWTYDDNITGWTGLLGDAAGGPDVPWSAAPARATAPADLAGLPPAYIEVGDLDIFRAEDAAYAAALSAAGVPTEFHVHPGCPHGFETSGVATDVGIRARADRIRALRSI